MDYKTVNVFISSSFSDMHAERDYLVEYVFPRLREWCEKRRLYLNDIDLRWGVSFADSQSDHTIRVCLERIDECRPFFLCFLGQRRGTVFDSISDETFDEYPELIEKGYIYSATELEIEHALLSPMLRIIEKNKVRKEERPAKAERALFFLRDDPFKNISLSPIHQRIFTNAGADDPAETNQKHAAFRALVRESCDNVSSYQCRFDTDKITAELIGYGADEAFDPHAEEGRLTDFMSDGEALSDVIIRQLKEMILAEYPDRREEAEDAGLTEEDLQSLTWARFTQFFIEREGAFDGLNRYILSDSNSVHILSAKSGSGKSTLLANYAETIEDRKVIMRFCGISRDSLRFTDVLRSVFESEGISLPPDDKSFINGLDGLFSVLSEKGKILIILDDITRTAEGIGALKMLPKKLPHNIKLIVSLRETPETIQFIEALRHTHNTETEQISAFERDDKGLLIKDFLSRNLKALDDDQIDYICSLSYTDNPLYLKIILKELRIYGSFDDLSEEIVRFGCTPEDAFRHLLDRLEQKIYNSFFDMQGASDYLFGLLSFTRAGIKKADIRTLIKRKYGRQCDECIEYILKCPRDYLSGVVYADADSKVDFLYDSFKRAAQARSVDRENELRNALADVFEISDPEECSYQLRMAGNDARLRELYSDPAFITRFCMQCGGWRLMREAGFLDDGIISIELSECFHICAQAFTDWPEKAPQILYKEITDPIFREKARALIHGRWLRFEPAESGAEQAAGDILPDDDAEAELAPYLENRYNTDSVASVRCFAPEADLAFVMLGPSVISVFRMSTAELIYKLPVDDDSPSKILTTADAGYFAVVSADCSLLIYELIKSDSDYMLKPVHEDECRKIRFKGMCAYSAGDAIIWQNADRELLAWRDNQTVSLGEYDEGQLAGAWDAGGLLTVWKEADGYVLKRDSASLTLEEAVNDVILWNSQLYIAVRDSVLYTADPVSLKITGTISTDNPLYTFAEYDGSLLATDEEFCLERIGISGRVSNLGNINYSNGSVNTNSFEHILACHGGVFYCSDGVCAKLRLKAGEQTHAQERFFNAVKDEDRQKVYEIFEGRYKECKAEEYTYRIEDRNMLTVYSSDGTKLGACPLDENLSGQYDMAPAGRKVAVLTKRARKSIGTGAAVISVLEIYDGTKRQYRKEYHADENIIAIYPDGLRIWVRGSAGFMIIDCENGYRERTIAFDFKGFAHESPVIVTDSTPVMFRTSSCELFVVSGEDGSIFATYPLSRSLDSLEAGKDGTLCFASEHGTCTYKIYKEDGE